MQFISTEAQRKKKLNDESIQEMIMTFDTFGIS